MVALRRLAALALLAAACHQPVEYSTTAASGVVKLRVSDNTVAGQASGFGDGRALASLGSGSFLVSTGSGRLHRFSSPDMSLDTSFVIGPSSGAGYADIILPKPGVAYVIGAAGRILEVNVGMGLVVDEITAGPLPVGLCASPASQLFYVVDGSDGRIREVDSADNSVLRGTDPLDEPAVEATVESHQDRYLLVACADDAGSVYAVDLATFYVSDAAELGSVCSGAQAFPAESIWAATHPNWYGSNGSVSVCANFTQPEVTPLPIAGHPVDVCSVPGTTLFYVLSYLGDGVSAVTAVDFITGEKTDPIPLDGFPWDITSHGNGEYVLVLTSEI